MADQPVMAGFPPPGVTPNFDNPENSSIHVVLAAILCPAFAIPLCVLRFYTGKAILKQLHVDDFLILCSLFFAVSYSVVQLIQVRYGVGKHIWDVTMHDFEMFNKLGIPGSVTYNLSTLFTKTSILCFYLRFSTDCAFRTTAYVVMFVAIGYSLAGAAGFLYLCRPIASSWDYSIPAECVNVTAWYLSCAVLNVVTDVVILLLPVWLIQPLRVKFRQKMAVAIILMAGGFVCGVSIIRLAAFLQGKSDMDITWQYSVNLMWCIIEMYTGIICACLPCLRAFVKHVFPDVLRRLSASPRDRMGQGTFVTPMISFVRIPGRWSGGNNANRNGAFPSHLPLDSKPSPTSTLTAGQSVQSPNSAGPSRRPSEQVLVETRQDSEKRGDDMV